ncbi:MAG TPA: xanthine dehydrogenase family protein molybdopterin-binding subunit, partial [Gammaproteobacteria bacterium]|nr:xanthine dehydrogenase family protein molybdopterin-binding subunit [Gammaproteobacteria bacterium]
MSIIFNPDRRDFLTTTTAAAGAGLILAFSLTSCIRSVPSSGGGSGGFRPSGWLRITPDNRITVIVDEAEMGQGVHTSLPMLVAEELEADFSVIEVEQAPVDNAVYGWQYTGGSTSVREGWERFRQAGAVAREMLMAAAAQNWQVPVSECRAQQGEIVHTASERRASYGELATAAAGMPIPQSVTLKEPDDFRLIGKSLPRVDAMDALDGTAVYGMDVKLPNLLTATIIHCPVFGGKAQAVDSKKAMAVAGVRHVVEIDAGVAVVAEHFWAAKKGADALDIQW